MSAVPLPEAAKRIGCSPDALRRLIARGRIHAVDIGMGSKRARYVIADAEIERFLSPEPARQKASPRRRKSQAANRRY